jgi:hypothetical protein
METNEWPLWEARRQDWLREAERHRLVALALAGQPTLLQRAGRGLTWLGEGLAALGARMQAPMGLEVERWGAAANDERSVSPCRQC